MNNKTTHKQFNINRIANYQTEKANDWIRNQGINDNNFQNLDFIFIQAQQSAYHIVKHHSNLLTDAQLNRVKLFIQKIQGTSKNKKLKPQFAKSILKMATKIKRQAYKQQQEAQIKIKALRSN